MEIRVLGTLEVVDDLGRLVAVRGTRLTNLVIALALRCGETVSDDRLSEILWGDEPPDGSNALRRQISTLRNALGRRDAVIRRANGYALAIEKDKVDLVRFERLAARGHDALRRGEVTEAVARLADALELFGGTLWSMSSTAVRGSGSGSSHGDEDCDNRGSHRRRPRVGTTRGSGRGARAPRGSSSRAGAPSGAADAGVVAVRPPDRSSALVRVRSYRARRRGRAGAVT